MSKFRLTRKVEMSEVVSRKQSAAARRAVKKAALESIKDQAQMAERAKRLSAANVSR